MPPPRNTPLLLKITRFLPFSAKISGLGAQHRSVSLLAEETRRAQSRFPAGSAVSPRPRGEPAAPSQPSPTFPLCFSTGACEAQAGEEESGPLCELNAGHVLR